MCNQLKASSVPLETNVLQHSIECVSFISFWLNDKNTQTVEWVGGENLKKSCPCCKIFTWPTGNPGSIFGSAINMLCERLRILLDFFLCVFLGKVGLKISGLHLYLVWVLCVLYRVRII